MSSKELAAPRFSEATDRGTVTNQGSYHQPGGNRHTPHCGCEKTTRKGAYRDVTVELPDGRVVHFYHQSPVVVRDGDTYRLDSHGYRTSTTKERINRHTPPGYKVIQRDFEWYVTTPDGDRLEFRDGMTITR